MTPDVLGALSVAHDASIEGRDPAPVLADCPMWARADRLLDNVDFRASQIRRALANRMKAAFGAMIDLSDNTMLGQLLNTVAQNTVDTWDLYDQVEAALQA